MGTPTLALHDDHLRVKLDRTASIATLSGDILVPYTTIASVDVVAPEWPPFFPPWRVGIHMPGFVARGTFGRSFRGRRRFLWFDRKTRRVLRLRLEGHARFEEISLDLPDAERMRDEIDARRAKR
jgi:hypothetical protein